jgi:hypothetical protein
LLKIRVELLEFEEDEEDVDVGWMAEKLRQWANGVRVVINKCNDVERHRADTVLEAVDWYNDNLDASDKNGRAMYVAGKKQAAKEANAQMEREVQQMKVQMEKKMEEQKLMYEAKLAKAGGDSPSNDAKSPASPTLPTPPRQPSDATPISAPILLTTSVPADPITPTASAQITFWKSKYERLADQNAELRKTKAKVEEYAVENNIDDKIEQIKQHFETQIEHQELADKNAELERRLQDRASSGEKRKAYGGLGYGEDESPKRARSDFS